MLLFDLVLFVVSQLRCCLLEERQAASYSIPADTWKSHFTSGYIRLLNRGAHDVKFIFNSVYKQR